MKGEYRFLLLDDNPSDAMLVKRQIFSYWEDIHLVSIDQRVNVMKILSNNWDLVICDYSMPQLTGIDVLHMIKSLKIDLPLIMISGTMGEEIAVKVMKEGAADYILKGNLERLNHIIERVIREKQRRCDLLDAQKALEESLFISKAVIKDSPLGIAVRDTTMKLIMYNDSWQRIWDFSDAEIEKQKQENHCRFDDFYDYAEDYLEELKELYNNGKELFIPEMKPVKRSKHRADWVSQHFYALKNNDNEVKLIVSITEDISELKEVRIMHKLHLQILEILIENGNWESALNNVIELLKTRLGYDEVYLDLMDKKENTHSLFSIYEKILTSDSIYENTSSKQSDSFYCNDLECIEESLSDDLVKCNDLLMNRECKSLAVIPIKSDSSIIGIIFIKNYDSNVFSNIEKTFLEEIVNTISIAIQKKESELELQRMHRELEKKVEIAVKELREKDHLIIKQTRQAARGEMISQLAHHWRQPLNAVGLIVQSLGDAFEFGELTTESFNKKIDNVMDVLSSLSRSIDDFREIYDGSIKYANFEVKKYINDIVRLMRRRFQNNNIDFEVGIECGGLLNGVPSEYSQAIINILENAGEILVSRKIKNPRVKMNCSRINNQIIITISDNAGGVKPELRDSLFELYVTGKEDLNNTGVGLYMSRQIIEKHMNGKIEYLERNEGAEFRIINNLVV